MKKNYFTLALHPTTTSLI